MINCLDPANLLFNFPLSGRHLICYTINLTDLNCLINQYEYIVMKETFIPP